MENELMHYGVLGMKWGVRKDRSSGSSSRQSLRKKNKTSDKKQNTKPKKKRISEMSDTEIEARIKRLEKEKQLKGLLKDVNPEKKSRGKKFVVDVLESIGKNALVNIGSQAATHALGVTINKMFDVDSSDVNKRIVNPQKGQSDKK